MQSKVRPVEQASPARPRTGFQESCLAACAQKVKSWYDCEPRPQFLRGPFERSTFLKRACSQLGRVRSAGTLYAQPQFFAYTTFLTGGVVYGTHRDACTDLEYLARDADKGVVLPLVQNANSLYGTRVFVELDLYERLPSAQELRQLLVVLLSSTHTLFGGASVRACVSTCSPRIKKGRSTLGVGVHVVFPDLVVHPVTLQNVLKFLKDALQQAGSPFASDLDESAVRPQSATLRMNGAPKRTVCEACALRAREEHARVACPPDCFQGSVFDAASVYELWLVATHSQSPELEVEFPRTWSTLAQLRNTSVFPDVHAQRSKFSPCSLSVDPQDVARNLVEKRVYLPQRDASTPSAKLARELVALIRRLFPEYSHISSLAQCVYQPDTQRVVGKQLVAQADAEVARRCLVAKRVHKSNTVFFTLDLRSKLLNFGCFDPDCRQVKKQCVTARSVTDSQTSYMLSLAERVAREQQSKAEVAGRDRKRKIDQVVRSRSRPPP